MRKRQNEKPAGLALGGLKFKTRLLIEGSWSGREPRSVVCGRWTVVEGGAF